MSQLHDALENSEEKKNRLRQAQNKLESTGTKMIEMEAQLKMALVEVEKKGLLLNQLNGRLRDIELQGESWYPYEFAGVLRIQYFRECTCVYPMRPKR